MRAHEDSQERSLETLDLLIVVVPRIVDVVEELDLAAVVAGAVEIATDVELLHDQGVDSMALIILVAGVVVFVRIDHVGVDVSGGNADEELGGFFDLEEGWDRDLLVVLGGLEAN